MESGSVHPDIQVMYKSFRRMLKLLIDGLGLFVSFATHYVRVLLVQSGRSAYPRPLSSPTSDFFNKGLRFQAGGVDPKELASQLVEPIATGKANPSAIVSSEVGIEDVVEYYGRFDRREETKVIIRFPR